MLQATSLREAADQHAPISTQNGAWSRVWSQVESIKVFGRLTLSRFNR